MSHWTEDDLANYLARAKVRLAPAAAAKPRKYRNVPTIGTDPIGDARTYDSAREARLAAQLNQRVLTGASVAWWPQVSIEIGRAENGRGVRVRVDALEVVEAFPDGSARIVLWDAKGVYTQTSRTKNSVLRKGGLDVRLA